MLTRKECIDSAKGLAQGNDIDRRNSARSLIDYCRIILGEIGSYHVGYLFVKNISIKIRYRLLSAAVPELFIFEELFDKIEKLRNEIEHDDAIIPSINELKNLIIKVEDLNQSFEMKIYPNLKRLDTTPPERLLEDWNRVLYLYDSLDDYLSSDMNGFDDVVKGVRDYFPIASRFKELSEKGIIDSRIKLRDLQLKLENLLEQGRKGRRKTSNF